MTLIHCALLLSLALAAAAEDLSYTGTWKGRGTKPKGDRIEFTVDGAGKISGSAELSFGKCKVGGEIASIDQATGKAKGKLTFEGTEFAFVDMRLSSPGDHDQRHRISGTTALGFELDVSGGGQAEPAKSGKSGNDAGKR